MKSVKLKKVPANIHIYPSVPQLAVLKMADVFITHGGMNSVSEALTFGTPMILLPFVSDQPVNARSMAKIGVGKVLDPSHIQAETLKSAVLSVLTDEKIHNNMKQIQQSIQNAPGNQGGAEMIIKYYGESK